MQIYLVSAARYATATGRVMPLGCNELNKHPAPELITADISTLSLSTN